jgi:hypothetical protein
MPTYLGGSVRRNRRMSKASTVLRSTEASLTSVSARRRAPPAATATPRDRLPAGTPLANRESSVSHIQVVPYPPSPRHAEQYSDWDEEEVPIFTNQSYLAELEAVSNTLSCKTAPLRSSGNTFADMARAGIVPGGHYSDFMASSEPQPLTSYIKFKKVQKSKCSELHYASGDQDQGIDNHSPSSRMSQSRRLKVI